MLDVVRLAERVHGHLGWLAAAALVHPAVLLRDPRRRADLSVALSAILVTAAAALGVWLYPPYAETLRQAIFLRAPRVGVLFERKEHLAVGAVVLTWAGAAAYAASRGERHERLQPHLRRLAFRAYVGAAALAAAVAAIGTLVATYKSF